MGTMASIRWASRRQDPGAVGGRRRGPPALAECRRHGGAQAGRDQEWARGDDGHHRLRGAGVLLWHSRRRPDALLLRLCPLISHMIREASSIWVGGECRLTGLLCG